MADAPIDVIARSNEELLKAALVLLSLKDEHFLEELKTIFAIASSQGNEIGKESDQVWDEIRREIGVIASLARLQTAKRHRIERTRTDPVLYLCASSPCGSRERQGAPL